MDKIAIKEALLAGSKVSYNGWSAVINSEDEVEIWAPNGEGRAASLFHLDKAIDDFTKEAGIPDKMPAPKKYDPTKSPKTVLGPDSTGKSPWKDPKINKSVVPDGKKPDTSLGEDSTGKSPWSDPSVNKRPEPAKGTGGLPDTSLGKDTTKNPVGWENVSDGFDKPKKAMIVDTFDREPAPGPTYRELIAASPSANLLKDIGDFDKWRANQVLASMGCDGTCDCCDKSGECSQMSVFDSEQGGRREGEPTPGKKQSALSPCMAQAMAKIAQSGGEVDWQSGLNNLFTEFYPEEVKNKIDGVQNVVDQNAPYIPPEEVENLKSQLLLALDFFNNKQYDQAEAQATEVEEFVDAMIKGASKKKAGPRIQEKWDDAGGYHRNLEAETPEELYHLTKSLGQEGAYDWASMKPRDPGEKTPDEVASVENAGPGDSASSPSQIPGPAPSAVAHGSIDKAPILSPSPVATKQAVDEAAKSYWKDYLKDYGADMAKDDSGNKSRSDKNDRKKNDKTEPEVDDRPGKDDKGSNVKEAQAIPGAAPSNSPGGSALSSPDGPAAPAGGAPSPGAAPGAAPAAPAQPKPGAGDAGLKALGWTDQDIKTMPEEDKQKVLQIKLKKPGTGVPAQPAAPGVGAPAPKAPEMPKLPPTGPTSGPSTPAVPGTEPGLQKSIPRPTASRQDVEKQAIHTAFRILTGQAAPNTPPVGVGAPTGPSIPPTGPSGGGSGHVLADDPAAVGKPPAPAAPAVPGAKDDFSSKELTNQASPEAAALDLYNKILQKTVEATTPEQVPAGKARELIQGLLTEVGMSVSEARALFGIPKDRGFDTLFK
jgi:hypothetical protein